MRPPRSVLVVAVALVIAGSFVPAGSAAPPPEGVCAVCGEEFERAAAENGIDATVTGSELTVQVGGDGESRWTANATLNEEAVSQFARNRTLLRRTVDRSYASSRTVVDNPENLSVALDGRTVTVTFTVADAARQYPGGVLLFDAFARSPPHGEPYVNADSLTVEGPGGTVITRAPAGGTVTGNRAVWTTDHDGGSDGPQLDRDSVVAFAPDGGLLAQAATGAAVRAHSLGMVESELRTYASLPAGLLALAAVALLLAGDRLPTALTRGRPASRWLAVGVGAYAALAALAFFVAGDGLGIALGVVGLGLAPQTFLTASAAISSDYLDVDAERDLGRVAAVAVAGWTVALVLAAPLSALLVVFFGPLVFLPFGVLAGADHRARFLFPVVAALGPVVTALAFVPQVGLVIVTPAMLALLMVGTTLLGIPLFAIGRRLGTGSAPTPGSPSPAA